MAVHAYRGVDDLTFREPLRHNYRMSEQDGSTVRLGICRGPLLLQAHEADADAETYVLSCGACARRVLEVDNYPISLFMDKHSTDSLNDAQMIGPRGYTGYLTPDYLRWCGVAGDVLERVKKHGPQYCYPSRGAVWRRGTEWE